MYKQMQEKFFTTYQEAFSEFYKIFNKNTVKVSYSCMENVGNIIKKHNRMILNRKPIISEDGCNCREKTRCPLKNKCLTTSIIYEANVTSDSENREKKYIGLTEGTFKKRFYGYQLSFKDRKYLKSSELSNHIWKVKDQGRNYRISWKIKNKATPYINGTKKFDLCLSEKLCILKADKSNLLNKRSEHISKCRHENKF